MVAVSAELAPPEGCHAVENLLSGLCSDPTDLKDSGPAAHHEATWNAGPLSAVSAWAIWWTRGPWHDPEEHMGTPRDHLGPVLSIDWSKYLISPLYIHRCVCLHIEFVFFLK